MKRTTALFRFGLRVLAIAAISLPAAAGELSPDDLSTRRTYLAGLLTMPARDAAALRFGCARGVAPEGARDARRRGKLWIPDAIDSCVTLLARLGREGLLAGVYQDLLRKEVGSEAGADELPTQIGGAVLTYKADRVALARGVSAIVTPSLAFDAGFTAGYFKAEALRPGLPTEAEIKPIGERCLDQRETDLAQCYSAGYIYAVRTRAGEVVSAAR